jgi:hypothetical protein
VWDPAKGRSQARIVYSCGRADDEQVVIEAQTAAGDPETQLSAPST